LGRAESSQDLGPRLADPISEPVGKGYFTAVSGLWALVPVCVGWRHAHQQRLDARRQFVGCLWAPESRTGALDPQEVGSSEESPLSEPQPEAVVSASEASLTDYPTMVSLLCELRWTAGAVWSENTSFATATASLAIATRKALRRDGDPARAPRAHCAGCWTARAGARSASASSPAARSGRNPYFRIGGHSLCPGVAPRKNVPYFFPCADS
jgi:hypothetical protein